MLKHYEVRTYIYCFLSEGARTETKYGQPLEFCCNTCGDYKKYLEKRNK